MRWKENYTYCHYDLITHTLETLLLPLCKPRQRLSFSSTYDNNHPLRQEATVWLTNQFVFSCPRGGFFHVMEKCTFIITGLNLYICIYEYNTVTEYTIDWKKIGIYCIWCNGLGVWSFKTMFWSFSWSPEVELDRGWMRWAILYSLRFPLN